MSLRKICCALIACLAVAAAALPATAMGRDPILFVHGWSGNGSNWSYYAGRFLLDGYSSSQLDLWSYDWTKSNVAIAQDVANEVAALKARTGAAKVDIVSHSMGGLNTRWYLKFLGGTANVDDWVSIGGPEPWHEPGVHLLAVHDLVQRHAVRVAVPDHVERRR